MMNSARAGVLGAAVVAACVCAGCAGSGVPHRPEAPGGARSATGESLAPLAAIDKVALGRSTRADVAAALGPAIVIPFDSGYQVWVYRWPGPDKTTRSATELVLLFDPSGLATKARLRPGYAARG